jgi:hypothetical protein
MLRAYKANGGELGLNNAVVRGTPRIAKSIFGKEVRVNVIHLQEDAGNKFIVYIDGVKKTRICRQRKGHQQQRQKLPQVWSLRHAQRQVCPSSVAQGSQFSRWHRS